MQQLSLQEWCEINGERGKQLLVEWNYEKNGTVTPERVQYNSSLSVWWKCSKCGRVWSTRVGRRTKEKTNCRCTSCKVVSGKNDLETWCKENNKLLLKEWSEKNNGNPSDFAQQSNKKAWWKCNKCGYEWCATISSRVRGKGCPSCSGRIAIPGVNDFESWCKNNHHEKILTEWDYSKNIKLPSNYTKKSEQKVWWKCSKCGYEWQSMICTHANGSSCPCCAGKIIMQGVNDLKTWCKLNNREKLLIEWDYEKNGITPAEISKSANKEVWWKCSKCGYQWKTYVGNRTNLNTGCPSCAGHILVLGVNDLETWCKDNRREDLLEEWNYEKNKKTPSNYAKTSNDSVWWKCSKCGNEWAALISNRVSQHTDCPKCNASSSLPEYAILYYCRQFYKNIIWRDKSLGFELDIYLPDYHVAIEYDGYYWHSSERKRKLDQTKDLECNAHGIVLIRIISSDKNTVLGNRIYFNDGFSGNNHYKFYNYALHELFKLLMKLTNVMIDYSVIDFNHDRDDIEAEYKKTIKSPENSVITNSILRVEWNYDKNKSLVPEAFSLGSSKKVWWKCSKCEYEWEAAINSRNNGRGCPVCGRKKTENSCRKKVQNSDTKEAFNSITEASLKYGISAIL